MRPKGLIVTMLIVGVLLACGCGGGGAGDHSATIPGEYTSEAGVMVLREDRTFDMTQRGVNYTGTYVESPPGSVRLTFDGAGTDTGEWKGDYIIDSEGIRWDKK